MSRPTKLEDWHNLAVELMARTGCSLKQAATELALPVSTEECALLLRRAGFQRLLWEARHRYFADLASDPNFKKDTMIGKLIMLAQKLEEEGKHADASDVWFKIGKTQGWVGPESTVSVFGELSQRDMDAIRAKVTSEGIKPKQVN